jgi:hypothetical protein
MPRFSSKPWGLEIRPIIGVRNSEWEFIVNPIVDLSFGAGGEADFAPAVRLARNLGQDRYVGLEYYADLGKIGDFLPLSEQSHQLFRGHRFQGRHSRCRARRGLRLNARFRSLRGKGNFGLRFPSPWKGQRHWSTDIIDAHGFARARDRQSDDILGIPARYEMTTEALVLNRSNECPLAIGESDGPYPPPS